MAGDLLIGSVDELMDRVRDRWLGAEFMLGPAGPVWTVVSAFQAGDETWVLRLRQSTGELWKVNAAEFLTMILTSKLWEV